MMAHFGLARPFDFCDDEPGGRGEKMSGSERAVSFVDHVESQVV
jgi:hypothetical protein